MAYKETSALHLLGELENIQERIPYIPSKTESREEINRIPDRKYYSML